MDVSRTMFQIARFPTPTLFDAPSRWKPCDIT